MREFFTGALGLALGVGMLAFALFMLGAGWAGIENQFGWWWGVASIVAALMFRFTLPITVGMFFCARDIWDWHWAFALLLAAPGLAFMIPGLVLAMLSVFKGSRA